MLPKPTQNRPSHIPALPPEQLEAAITLLHSVPAIDPVTKVQMEEMLRAAANPDSQKLEAIIPTLEPERQVNIEDTIEALTQTETAVLSRGRQGLQAMSDTEWDRLVDDANAADDTAS